MDKRKSRRIKKRLLAKINNQASILSDVSNNGLKLSTASIPSSRAVDIILQADKQTFNIKGYTRWVSRKVSAQKLYDIGVTIEEAPEEYYEFINKLRPHITNNQG